MAPDALLSEWHRFWQPHSCSIQPMPKNSTFRLKLTSTLANESCLDDQSTRGGQLPRDSNSALIEAELPQYSLGCKLQHSPSTLVLMGAGKVPNSQQFLGLYRNSLSRCQTIFLLSSSNSCAFEIPQGVYV